MLHLLAYCIEVYESFLGTVVSVIALLIAGEPTRDLERLRVLLDLVPVVNAVILSLILKKIVQRRVYCGCLITRVVSFVRFICLCRFIFLRFGHLRFLSFRPRFRGAGVVYRHRFAANQQCSRHSGHRPLCEGAGSHVSERVCDLLATSAPPELATRALLYLGRV